MLDGQAETRESQPGTRQANRQTLSRTTSSNTLVNMVRSRVDLKGSRKGMHH